MGIADVLLLVVRWLHALAAVAWVGGSIFYAFVLRPAHRRGAEGQGETAKPVAEEFRALVYTAMGVLLSTGIVLTASRLTSGKISAVYVGVLALKVALALCMFYLARFRSRAFLNAQPIQSGPRRLLTAATGTTAILVLGVVVFLLADLLQVLVEARLAD